MEDGTETTESEVASAIREILMIVRHLVNHPEEVRVVVRPGELRVVAELFTHPQDVGQVIGRGGHISSSIRSLLSAIAGKHCVQLDFDYVTEIQNYRRDREQRLASAHRVESVS